MDRSWRSVVSFLGTSSTKSEPFTIRGGAFRLKWSYKGDPNISPTFYEFGFVLYPKGELDLYITQLLVPGQPDREGVEEVHEGPGEYHLLVVAKNLKEWKIEVEESC